MELNRNLYEKVHGKKVTLMGLGVLGRGIQVAQTLLKYGAILHITDMKSYDQLKESLLQLDSYGIYTTRLGEHVLEDFSTCDLVVKAGGIPYDSIYINHARSLSIPVVMDASLALSCFPEGVTTIGVTGTKGKSTVTHWIYESLRTYYRDTHSSVYIGGNVRGGATLPLVDTVKSSDYVVLELDSWQLQGFGDEKLSPHIAVFTNFMEDHLNYYKGSMQRYFDDKANIFKYQNKGDHLIFSESTKKVCERYYNGTFTSEIRISDKESLDNYTLTLLGEHNRNNAKVVKAALSLCGLSESYQKKAIEEFSGVEGRLHYVGNFFGRNVYNDNNSTIPQSTILSLKALQNKQLILVCGGNKKDVPYDDFVALSSLVCKKIIVLPGDIRDLLDPEVCVFVDTMNEAVEAMFSFSIEGDTILFSPAGTSFASFINEYDRNDQFLENITIYTKKYA